jgi:hypothetical protein
VLEDTYVHVISHTHTHPSTQSDSERLAMLVAARRARRDAVFTPSDLSDDELWRHQ